MVVVTLSGVPSDGGSEMGGSTGWILVVTKTSLTREVYTRRCQSVGAREKFRNPEQAGKECTLTIKLDLPVPSSPQTQSRTTAMEDEFDCFNFCCVCSEAFVGVYTVTQLLCQTSQTCLDDLEPRIIR